MCVISLQERGVHKPWGASESLNCSLEAAQRLCPQVLQHLREQELEAERHLGSVQALLREHGVNQILQLECEARGEAFRLWRPSTFMATLLKQAAESEGLANFVSLLDA